MKHLESFDFFGKNSIELVIKFNDKLDFYKALNIFDTKSSLLYDKPNREFKTISFICYDQNHALNTKKTINCELLDNNIKDFSLKQKPKN